MTLITMSNIVNNLPHLHPPLPDPVVNKNGSLCNCVLSYSLLPLATPPPTMHPQLELAIYIG